MIVLIPLIRQSDYTELKYCLRSLDKFLKKPFILTIAGESLPDWIDRKKIVQILQPDEIGKKQRNIRNKVLVTLRLTERLFFMSDDVYLTKEIDPLESPYFASGSLKNRGEPGSRALMDQLLAYGKQILDYDVHCCIRYESDFKEVISKFTDDCIIKSAYGNYLELQGVEMPDFKVNRQMKEEEIRRKIKDRPYFSTGPQGLKFALPILEEFYPEPSKFELNV